jgi:hypothetical protein
VIYHHKEHCQAENISFSCLRRAAKARKVTDIASLPGVTVVFLACKLPSTHVSAHHPYPKEIAPAESVLAFWFAHAVLALGSAQKPIRP